MRKFLNLVCVFALAVGFSACEKEKPEPPAPDMIVYINDGPEVKYFLSDLGSLFTEPVTKLVFGEGAKISGNDIKAIRDQYAALEYIDMTKATIFGLGYNDTYYGNTTTTYVVGGNMFYNMKKLKTVLLPINTISIGTAAFRGCSSLTSITIPEGVTKIGMETFQECTSLASINFGAQVQEIGVRAFQECTSLVSITLPPLLTTISYSLFHTCTSLNSVIIPPSVTTINDEAFWYCRSLTSLTFPAGVTVIGKEILAISAVQTLNLQSTTPPELRKEGSFSLAFAWADLMTINIPKEAAAAYNTVLNNQSKGWEHTTTGAINLVPGGSVAVKELAGFGFSGSEIFEFTISAILDL